jgi:hypothetical protein
MVYPKILSYNGDCVLLNGSMVIFQSYLLLAAQSSTEHISDNRKIMDSTIPPYQ